MPVTLAIIQITVSLSILAVNILQYIEARRAKRTTDATERADTIDLR